MIKKLSFVVPEDYKIQQRVDKYITELDKTVSRNIIKKSIDNRQLLINGIIKVRSNYLVMPGDKIDITCDVWSAQTETEAQSDIEFKIQYEDEDVIVVNKPKNLVVHPGAGNKNSTLVNALKFYLSSADNSDVEETQRFGLVHRIDKQTTGLLLIAKNKKAFDFLNDQMKKRLIHRSYVAVVRGTIKENSGKIDAPIGRDRDSRIKMAVTQFNSKLAITKFKVVKRISDKFTVIQCELETGRTHQIRVHMSYIKHSIVGDYVYGPKSQYDGFGQYLHAFKLEFQHPTKNIKMSISAPLPKEFNEFVSQTEIDNFKW
jgi:23S rRNA pseudouridine1911/1915/1917 synthase